jgi:hypothetical protein
MMQICIFGLISLIGGSFAQPTRSTWIPKPKTENRKPAPQTPTRAPAPHTPYDSFCAPPTTSPYTSTLVEFEYSAYFEDTEEKERKLGSIYERYHSSSTEPSIHP